MAYITGPSTDTNAESCVFCEVRSEGNDRSRLVLCRWPRTLVVMNKYPYNNGHLLIMPKTHVGRFDDLDRETFAELHELLKRSVGVLETGLAPDGMNIGLNFGKVAGAGIPGHLHYHVVPRWIGDTNFMPITGLTKVISEHLLETYDQLQPLF